MLRRLPPALAATFASLAVVVLAAPAIAQQKPSAASAQVQPLKQFRDWVVGCDNARSCTTLGLSPDEGMLGPYVKIGRAGDTGAAPQITFAMVLDDSTKVASARLRLTLDGKDIPGLPAQPLPANVDGDLVRASLAPVHVDAFVAALRNGTRLNVRLLDGAKEAASGAVSLAGSAAALLYMDDQQKRVGTVTALARKGDAPASSILPVPDLPAVAAKRMTEIDKSKPPLPRGIVRPREEGCKDYPDMVFRLSPSQFLWGLCAQPAAYNFDYTFFVAGQGRAQPAAFTAQGFEQDRGPGVLTSPSLSEDGMVLNSYAKGRGIGDCGVSADWAWDGAAFRLMRVSMMDPCRGVLSDDWPVLFRAKRG
jgi:invasion protein IalB